MTNKTAQLTLNGKSYNLPVVEGSEGEIGVDISNLRTESGYITLDDGYGNTGSCRSAITFIDGEKGILRYRGIPIEELAEQSNFLEVAYLVIYGHLPKQQELAAFEKRIASQGLLHEDMKYHFQGFPSSAHPMAVLSSMINTSGCFSPLDAQDHNSDEEFDVLVARLISQVRTIAAFAYRKSRGLPIVYPNPANGYTEDFLHMMFARPNEEYSVPESVAKALDVVLLLHADHEQNCSTATVRMVASSRANLFASVAAGVCALWGPLHGGANQAVIEMLQQIHDEGDDGSKFIEAAKDKNSGRRLMGFGHRVYKNYDPRARIIKKACDRLLNELKIQDPLLDIAKRLEEAAVSDSYFVERKLYPNVDFYSGIIMRALGIPLDMFTVMFAIGRMPGWIGHFRELRSESGSRINRPRQIYTGATKTAYTPMDER